MQGEKKHIAPPKAVLAVYWSYVKQQWPLALFTVAMAFVVQGAELAGPWFIRRILNLLATNTPSPATVHTLVMILGFAASMWVLSWLARRTQDMANSYLAARVMTKLYTDAFEYLLRHSYNFFISNFSGTLTHRISRYARAYELIYDTFLLTFLPAFLYVMGAAGVLFIRNHTLGLILFVWAVAFVWFQFYIAKWRQPSRNARAEADTKVTGTLADAIGNQSTIVQFSGVEHEKGIFGGVVALWRAATLRSWVLDGWTWGVINLFVLALQGGVFYGAIIFWQRGLLTVGDFVLIQSYLLGTFGQLTGLGYQLRRFYDSFADAGEMVAILETPHEIRDRKGAKPLTVSVGEVWFDNLNFYFNKLKPVLKDFNLTIAGGERVALVGPSGAGKSTITKLLLRLYDLPEGEIKIDKQDIAKVTQESLRNAIAFVPQEPILFHRTLMENIRYGRRDASDDEVIEAAKKAHCHEFISGLAQGYDTFVGERGVKLSGGERQRVAIARAILKNAPILVLDEATSSLDSESEALIQDALEILMEGKTVIVIAHRLSTIMKMDRIVVMEQGKVVATGTHLELIREKGLYQKLWSIQAGGFIGDSGSEDEQALQEGSVEDEDLLAQEVDEK